MQKRISRVLSISIISVACFALPVSGWAQSKPSDGTTTAAPDTQNKRGATFDKAGVNNKKEAPGVDKKQEPTPGANNAEPVPAK